MPIQFSNAGVAPLWNGLDLDVQPGEFIAILGPNGSGQSPLLNTILGTRTPSTRQRAARIHPAAAHV